MILDTSAILAVLLREAELRELSQKMTAARHIGVGAPTLVEASLVLSARQGGDSGALSAFLAEVEAVVIPFERAHCTAATDAFLRFGKGRHPAALSFGDCLAYATAKVANEPLLCKGDHFAMTDLQLA